MQYVYIIMKVVLTEQGEEIVASTSYNGIPQVYAKREECHQDLEDGEFLMAVPVQGKDYPLGW